jgi:hypothetical protein
LLAKNPYMGLENLQQHINAVIDLWRLQKAQGLVSGESPRSGAAIKGLIRHHKRSKEKRKRSLYLDKGVGTVVDGYRQPDVLRIANYFFEKGTMVSFRSRVDFLMGHSMLCRSEDKRNACLSNLGILELENEGPTSCQAMILTLARSKTNQEGRNEIGVAIRHKDVFQCPVGALAFYLFFRFHLSAEPFPDFSSNRGWYDTRMLRGKCRDQPLTYDQQRQAITVCFADLKILSSRKTHAMRGQGK